MDGRTSGTLAPHDPARWCQLPPLPMADAPYLVALALLERGDQRALPLTGKSQRPEAAAAAEPDGDGYTLALELLLRLWQQSSETPIRRLAADDGLLLVEMPLEAMQDQLPQLKAA